MGNEVPDSLLDTVGPPLSDHFRQAPVPWLPPPHSTVYRERVWIRPNLVVVIATELDDNPGPSITNNAEGVHANIELVWRDALVIEHYPPRSGRYSWDETFDLVTIRDGRPVWHRLDPDLVHSALTSTTPRSLTAT